VVLPEARTLSIRPMRASDAEGLIALYAGLDEDDLYRRFFSGHPPPESFVQKMTKVTERGGFGLTAVTPWTDCPATFKTAMSAVESEQARPARVQGRPAKRPRRTTAPDSPEAGWMAVRCPPNAGTRVARARRGGAIGRRTPTRTGEGWRNVRYTEGRSGSLSSPLRSSAPQPAMAGPDREEDHGFT
jgi:hypothetical protein